MATVNIRGKEFPLCLTVAAVDEINQKCGSIKNIGTFLDGASEKHSFNLGAATRNTAWILALLLREGEENRLICAKFDGCDVNRSEVPDEVALGHLLTMAQALECRNAVLSAVSESLHQEIEASHSKNAESTEQK